MSVVAQTCRELVFNSCVSVEHMLRMSSMTTRVLMMMWIPRHVLSCSFSFSASTVAVSFWYGLSALRPILAICNKAHETVTILRAIFLTQTLPVRVTMPHTRSLQETTQSILMLRLVWSGCFLLSLRWKKACWQSICVHATSYNMWASFV